MKVIGQSQVHHTVQVDCWGAKPPKTVSIELFVSKQACGGVHKYLQMHYRTVIAIKLNVFALLHCLKKSLKLPSQASQAPLAQ